MQGARIARRGPPRRELPTKSEAGMLERERNEERHCRLIGILELRERERDRSVSMITGARARRADIM